PHLFPESKVSYDKHNAGNWDSISAGLSNQAVVLTAKEFGAEEYELQKLYDFAKGGNYVFIIANSLSYDADQFFNSADDANSYDFLDRDSLQVALERPPFASSKDFVFPGKTYESHFTRTDTGRASILGRGTTNGVNFIQMKVGTGAIFIHLSPLAFSNYFLLHKNNIDYYRTAFSVLPQGLTSIVWNDYYLRKVMRRKEKDRSWFRMLMKYDSFRWGLLTAMGGLLLFVLMEMRRKQRYIPEKEEVKNDSLDFVKTIGRLYYDKGDHKNLAHKMGTYFIDHLRTRYKLPTYTFDEHFIKAVHLKSGYPLVDVERLVRFIQFTETAPHITEAQLSDLHHQLDLFYQNT
ncbi:MAG TPA: hypothetical protein VM935_01795, partial [Chitinophagaceae bacterium]|nr:hypothetical protein [Chitinophagaceae bacterium]